MSADDDSRSATRNGHRLTEQVARHFSLDRIADLDPGTAVPIKNPYLPGAGGIWAIRFLRCAGNQSRAVIRESYRFAEEVVLVFSINVSAELHPVGTIPLEDTDMPSMFAGTVVVGGAYSQAISIGRQRQIKPEIVVAGLAQEV